MGGVLTLCRETVGVFYSPSRLGNIYSFFIIQRVKARAIPSPYHPPTRGDNTVPVAQGSTATPCATKQLLAPDSVFKRIIYIYIYILARSTNSRDYIGRSFIFIFCVQFVIFVKTRLLSAVDVIATVS